MLMWRCDLCKQISEAPIWSGLVWPYGINVRLANGKRKTLTPAARCDLCDACVEAVAKTMRTRGAPGNVGGGASGSLGCAPKCCNCGKPSEGVLRIVAPDTKSWHRYAYTGTFCARHLKPFFALGAPTRTYGQRRLEVIEIRRRRELVILP